MNLLPRCGRQRGVSLIEALVALAVMAIGMLGIVGVQGTLRTNSDVAKQRSEALRLAQFDIEQQRAFVAIGPSGAASAFLSIQSASAPASGVNATFTVTRNVVDLPASSPGRSVDVSVSWTDRTNDDTQRVRLATIVAGIAPDLAPTMSVPGDGDVVRRPGGRNRGIPVSAQDLGNGTSGFMPPRAPGVAWVFNNITGLITLCSTTATSTGDLTPANIHSCATGAALLVAGYFRYSIGPSDIAPPSATNFDALTGAIGTEALDLVVVRVSQSAPAALAGTRNCFTGEFDGVTVAYYCAVPVLEVPGTTPTWSGFVYFGPLPPMTPLAAASAADLRRVCRYHGASDYTLESNPKLNQNYLVIRAGNGATRNFCPSPTLAHQPAS